MISETTTVLCQGLDLSHEDSVRFTPGKTRRWKLTRTSSSGDHVNQNMGCHKMDHTDHSSARLRSKPADQQEYSTCIPSSYCSTTVGCTCCSSLNTGPIRYISTTAQQNLNCRTGSIVQTAAVHRTKTLPGHSTVFMPSQDMSDTSVSGEAKHCIYQPNKPKLLWFVYFLPN